ncbi:MAG: hypothetical protein M1440_01365 [Gammaproteobacteria bacterium]|nr:hypothetical protein [Gammaproteobacteria bacterium]
MTDVLARALADFIFSLALSKSMVLSEVEFISYPVKVAIDQDKSRICARYYLSMYISWLSLFLSIEAGRAAAFCRLMAD